MNQQESDLPGRGSVLGMGRETSEDDGRIATNLRTLLIMEALARAARPLTPTEINAHVGLPKQSIHRLCRTLVDAGFLIRDADPKRLSPSRRLLAMASGLFAASRGDIVRHQILEAVAAQVGETVNFVVPELQGMTYLDRVETDWPFRIQLPVGSHVPFHCTASGKCFLASLSSRRRTALIGSLQLTAMARNTITDAADLTAEAEAVAANGYSVDNEEFMDGMVAVAVPVGDPDGRLFAALAFHAPTQRMSREQAVSHVAVLQEGARRLSELLF